MKNAQLSKLRKRYMGIALGFMSFILGLLAIFVVVIHTSGVQVAPEPEVVADRAMTARIPGKGTFYMEPDLLVYCGQVPAPADWNFFTDDGTIDQATVMEFSNVLTKWEECATEYASVIRAYAVSTEMLRDVVVESAGNFFLEFVTEPEMLGEDFSQGENGDHAGTFIQGRPCEACHGDKYKQE